jgi:ABC-type glycerol-3-phosphate transport system substrate-binding protein
MESSASLNPTRRTVLAGALGLGATAVLTSCGLGGSGSDSKTLTVAYFGDPKSADSLSKVADPFRKANPGVTVKFVGTTGTDWNEFFTKLLAQIAAGNPPDIVSVATEGVQLFASKDLAEPLDEYVTRDKSELQSYFSDVHPSLVEAMMYEGSLYELPTDFNCGNMYFNTSLMKQAGVDYPAADWTMDDFHGMAKKISTAAPDAVAFNWVVRLWGSWTSFMYANGGNLLTEGKYGGGDWLWDSFYANDPAAQGRGGGWQWGDPTANSDAVVESLEYMLRLKGDGLAPQPDAGGGGTLQGLFTNDKIGMTIGGGFWAGGLHNAGMGMEDFDVQLFPKWKTQRHLFGTGGFGMLRSSKNKELAWELMKSMASVDGINVLTAGNVTTPARKSMMTADRYATTGPKNWQVFYDTLTELPDTAPIPAPPYYNQMATALVSRTTQALSSGNVKSALDGLQGDLESAAAAVL